MAAQVKPSEFRSGDRVVLRGLTRAPHLNGRHGTVAAIPPTITHEGRCAVHLDILLTTVAILPSYLEKEDLSLASYAIQDRCAVYDGVLVDPSSCDDDLKRVGSAIIYIFYLMRWIVATSYVIKDDETNNISILQIPNLPTAKSLELNAYAIQHWVQNPQNGTTGVWNSVAEFFKQTEDHAENGFIVQTLKDSRAMKSWHLGVQKDFWFVGRDYTGSYVVPDGNKDIVYKVVGISNKLQQKRKKPGDPVALIKTPMRLTITVLPWYGRLLYDTTIGPPREEHVLHATDPALANGLHVAVLKSIQAGSVIEHWAELEDSKCHG